MLTDTDIVDLQIKNIVETLYNILKSSESKVFPSDAKKVIWSTFNEKLSDGDGAFHIEWEKIFLRLLYVEKPDLLRFKLSFIITKELISANIGTAKIITQNDLDTKLSPKEENIIRYVSGYVPYALIKFYNRYPNNNTGKSFIKTLDSLATVKSEENKKSFLFYTSVWMDCTDRGGLFNVNDTAYLFFRSMENCVRSAFNINLIRTYNGENLAKLMKTELSTNSHVIYHWDCVTENSQLNEVCKRHLLQRIITYWVNIRGNAFAKAWVDQNKKNRAKNLSKKGEHSLRKQLNTTRHKSKK